MAEIFVDGIKYQVADGQNLLHAVLSLGLNLPYFCWHPALGSVGACRQCAVIQYRDEKDTKGKIVMACMTPAVNGARISINSVDAKTFRSRVIEWLMVNHPHDCPVCDEGGECHLQDMTVMTGHNYRRFHFKKRTHRNQYLGPFVNHEMNRCIACYRCVRFYRDYAAGNDLDVFAAHDWVYFGRQEDGVLESEFSGNLVEVCPTGVFTDKTLKRHYTRKWDLQTAPSVCNHCGLGCNTIPGERYGKLRRIRNRFNIEVNGYFICDRGRYGYEFVECDKRIRAPKIRYNRDDAHVQVGENIALSRITEILSQAKGVAGIGSPRASMESNYALKTLVGPERFSSGLADRENNLISQILGIMQNGPARSASLQDVQNADAILILGEDLTNTAPMLALEVIQASHNEPMQKAIKLKVPKWDDISVRELIQDDKGPLYSITPLTTKLDKVMRASYHLTPAEIARMGFEIAAEINSDSPQVKDLPDDLKTIVSRIASDLKNAQRPVIISGTSLFNRDIIAAAANVAWALNGSGKPAQICYTVPECNCLGAGIMQGDSLEKIFEWAKNGEIDTAIILENNLYRRAEKSHVEQFFANCKNIIAIDCLENGTIKIADIVLPASTFAEGDGSLINNEGRVQRYFQVKPPVASLKESWRWIGDIIRDSDKQIQVSWNSYDEIANSMFADIPLLNGKRRPMPPADFRIDDLKIARKQARYSGRTAEYADVTVHEPMPPADPDSAMKFSMEGYRGKWSGSLNPEYWAPGWNSIQSLNKYQTEIGDKLYNGDPGVRLIEPLADAKISFYNKIPQKFEPRPGEWLIVPLYHIYGSEELSSEAEGLCQLVPDSYIALNPKQAAAIESGAGGLVSLAVGEKVIQLPLLSREGLPDGVAGLPVGLKGLLGITLPSWGKIS